MNLFIWILFAHTSVVSHDSYPKTLPPGLTFRNLSKLVNVSWNSQTRGREENKAVNLRQMLKEFEQKYSHTTKGLSKDQERNNKRNKVPSSEQLLPLLGKPNQVYYFNSQNSHGATLILTSF